MNNSPNIFALILLIGWLPLSILLFAIFPPRRAILVAFIAGWLFLPMADIKLAEGIPVYSKMTAVNCGVFLGVVAFDLHRLMIFRARWLDLPMAIWCICPMASSLSNGLGIYDGLSGILNQTLIWGLPYLVGRVYFMDAHSLLELAKGIFIGGLIYVPLCLCEDLMGPQLHYRLYGFYQHSYFQHVRDGGYRPLVFMQHGLMVSLWMAVATLAGLALWRTGTLRRWMGQPIPICVGVLAVTTILCKSMNALVLGLVGCCVVLSVGRTYGRWILILLLLIPIVYMGVRLSGLVTSDSIFQIVGNVVNENRAQSLQARLIQEDLFSAKAMQRPVFGWGGWGRIYPTDEDGKWLTRGIDSLWIITLSYNGIVGLSSLFAILLLPALILLSRSPILSGADATGMIVACILSAMFAIDCLFNGMINPIFILAIGGLSGLASVRPLKLPRPITCLGVVGS